MTIELFLIGTVHVDFDGKTILDYALNYLSPKAIGVELYQSALDRMEMIVSDDVDAFFEFEQKHMDQHTASLRADPAIKKLWEQAFLEIFEEDLDEKSITVGAKYSELVLSLSGFEYKSSLIYSKKNDIPLYLIDLPQELPPLADIYVSSFIGAAHNNPNLKNLFKDALSKGLPSCLKLHRRICQSSYKSADTFRQSQEDYRQGKITDPLQMQMYNPRRDEYMIEKIIEIINETKKGRVLGIVGLGHLEQLLEGLKDFNPEGISLNEIL